MKYKIIVFFLCIGVFVFGAPLTLIDNGTPKAVIVLENNPTCAAQLGAYELNHHLKMITGTELQVVNGDYKGSLAQIIIKGADVKPSADTIVKCEGNKIYLTGFDSTARRKVDYINRKGWPDMDYDIYSPLLAVYDFLEDECGVRFYGVTDKDTCFVSRKTLTVEVKNRTNVPPCDAFREVWPSINVDKNASRRDLFLWRFRWRMMSHYGRSSHNMYTIYYKHFRPAKQPHLKSSFKGYKPELFAQKPDHYGKDPILAQAYPADRDVPPQLCYSNPETIKFFADETVTYLKGQTVPGGWGRGRIRTYEGIPFYYPIQNSDVPYGYCQCENCKKGIVKGSSSDCSAIKFKFISDVAEASAKIDKRAGVATLAYIETYKYPENVKLADNVSVQLCPVVYSWWHPLVRERQYSMYKKWIEKEGKKRPLTLWTYLFNAGTWDGRFHYGDYTPFIDAFPWQTAAMFREFVNDGIKGMFVEADMTYCKLDAYLAMRLAYDKNADGNKIIDEYFNNYYGKAGDTVKAFFKKCEKLYWSSDKFKQYLVSEKNKDAIACPKGTVHNYWTTGLLDFEAQYANIKESDIKELDALMTAAAMLADTPETKSRVAELQNGIWKTAKNGFAEYQAYLKRKNDPNAPVVIDYKMIKGKAVTDPAASKGKVKAMHVNKSWVMNFHVPRNVKEGDYKVVAHIRTNAPKGESFYFNLGTWDAPTKTQKYKGVLCDDISGRKYIPCDLGTFKIKPGLLFFFGGIMRKTPGNKKFDDPDIQIYCDKVEFIRVTDKK